MVLSESDKNKIIAWKDVGIKAPEIAKKLEVDKNTIYRFLRRLNMSPPGEIPGRKPGTGRPRKMTPSKIAAVKHSVSDNPMLSSTATFFP